MGVRPTQLTDIICWLGIGPHQLTELINVMGDALGLIIEKQENILNRQGAKGAKMFICWFVMFLEERPQDHNRTKP